MPDSKGKEVAIKKGRDLKPFIEMVFARIVKIPRSIINEAAKTAKEAADHIAEGTATAVTYVSASDAVYDGKSATRHADEVKAKGATEETVIAFEDRSPQSPDVDDQVSGSIEGGGSSVDGGFGSSGDQGAASHSSEKIINGLFGKSSIVNSKGKRGSATKAKSIRKCLSGEMTRAHFFVVLGKSFTPAAIARFDENGDGKVMFDEFSAEFNDTLRCVTYHHQIC